MSNTGNAASVAITYPVAPAGYSLTKSGSCSGAIPANASCVLTFTFSPNSAGSFAATYTIDLATGTDIPITLSGTGVAATPNVTATPIQLPFGSVTIGTTSPAKTVTVANTGTGAATDMSYPAAPPNYTKGGTCGSANLPAGASCTLTFTYSPTSTGSDNASYTFSGGGKSLAITIMGSGVAPASAVLGATPSTLSFGTITVESTSAAQTITVRNTGAAPANGINLANSNASEFVVSGNTCGATLAPGATCTLSVTYAPGAAGSDSATLTFTYAGGGALAISLTGTGVASTPPPGTGQLSLPAGISMPDTTVGTTSASQVVTLGNVGTAAVTVSSITSANAAEFAVSGSTCSNVSAGSSCTFNVTFSPAASGARSGTITVTSTGSGSPQAIVVSGNGLAGSGGPLPPTDPNVVTAVEYYHAAFDHYFITSIADEIDKLDRGVFVGWQRTGKQFNVYRAATSDLRAVCRFFSTAFDPKSSHFYTPDAGECTTVKANKDWQFEAEVFYTRSPALDGACPVGTNPVYRLYNDGQGAAPNHRYTTDFATRAQMLLKGWMAEGYGVGVIMCAPQ